MGRQSWGFPTIYEYNRSGKCFVSGGRYSPVFEFLQHAFGTSKKQLSNHHTPGHVYTLHAFCVGQVDCNILVVHRLVNWSHVDKWPGGNFLHDWHLDAILRRANNVVHNQQPDYSNRQISFKRRIKTVDWHSGIFFLTKYALELNCFHLKVFDSI